jgi:hypothetical protein
MALQTAPAPHSGPLDTPGELAYRYARSGIARSATTRSNYVAVQIAIDWIVRDWSGAITSVTDIRDVVLLDSLQIRQAINDEPDTCSLTLKPQDPPAAIPQVGQEIRVTWAPGSIPLFHGYIVTTQSDWQLLNQQPPWVAIQCQDAMWRFDARMVTYRFPTQSATTSIAFLIQYFCNLDPNVSGVSGLLDFSTAFVELNMPTVQAFDVVNQRPSTVMRTLTASVGGGFYIEGFTVHAWANSVSEPNSTNPIPLTVGLGTLHTFRLTQDATQLRRRVLVEGKRTSTLTGLPTVDKGESAFLGVPVQDATIFPATTDPDFSNLARLGTQWIHARAASSVTAAGANPPQTKTQTPFAPEGAAIYFYAMPMTPPPQGWIRIGNQYTRYKTIYGTPSVDGWGVALPTGPFAYGKFTVPIPAGEMVEWVDNIADLQPHGLTWDRPPGSQSPGEFDLIRTHPPDTPVVVLAMAQVPIEQWPPLEGFVQDGRYSYAGAQARADDDLATFQDPLLSAEWATDDLNAIPGRSQVIALSSETVNPAINTTVTITHVEIRFPLPTLPPRRTCIGGSVKRSTFLDLVLTETN